MDAPRDGSELNNLKFNRFFVPNFHRRLLTYARGPFTVHEAETANITARRMVYSVAYSRLGLYFLPVHELILKTWCPFFCAN